MQQIIRGLKLSGRKYLTALPNAGYPQIVSNRMIFANRNVDYFATKVSDIAADGADMVGGCCGTTPEYIRRMRELVKVSPTKHILQESVENPIQVYQSDTEFFGDYRGPNSIQGAKQREECVQL